MKTTLKEEVKKIIEELNLGCSIEEFKDKVDWNWISRSQKLSEGFIRELNNSYDS